MPARKRQRYESTNRSEGPRFSEPQRVQQNAELTNSGHRLRFVSRCGSEHRGRCPTSRTASAVYPAVPARATATFQGSARLPTALFLPVRSIQRKELILYSSERRTSRPSQTAATRWPPLRWKPHRNEVQKLPN